MAALDEIGFSPNPPDGIDVMYQKINDAIAAVNRITADNVLATKVVQIGDWDMDANSSVNIAHGIADFLKIRMVNALIISDDSSTAALAPRADALSSEIELTIYTTSTNIQLSRRTGSAFDSTNWDATGFNRGFVTIIYEV